MSHALPNQLLARKRPNKYYAKQCWGCDACGVTWDTPSDICPACNSSEKETLLRFDSRAERKYWVQLRLLLRAGKIENLHRQVPYPLVVNGFKIGSYIADFAYVEAETRAAIICDVKGISTPVYRLKKRLMKALYSIDIVEISTR